MKVLTINQVIEIAHKANAIGIKSMIVTANFNNPAGGKWTMYSLRNQTSYNFVDLPMRYTTKNGNNFSIGLALLIGDTEVFIIDNYAATEDRFLLQTECTQCIRNGIAGIKDLRTRIENEIRGFFDGNNWLESEPRYFRIKIDDVMSATEGTYLVEYVASKYNLQIQALKFSSYDVHKQNTQGRTMYVGFLTKPNT